MSAATFGLGLRKPHYDDFLGGDQPVPVDFVEVISENFMVAGGKPRNVLRQVRERHPVALHGVSMSVGSADGVDPDYLKRLRALVDEIEPLFVSDHLCWTGVEGFNSHDLLPLPYTQEALDVVCTNVAIAQDALGRAMLIENPSSYVAFSGAPMTEWEFLGEICARTGCGLLLDVNNIYRIFPALSQSMSLEALDGIYGSLDGVTLALDSPLFRGGYPLLMLFDGAHRLGSLSGPNMAATLVDALKEPLPGARARIRSVRPLGDAAAPAVSILGSSTLAERPSETVHTERSAAGIHRMRRSCNFCSVKIAVPAGADWSYLQGYDMDVEPGGRP